MPYVRKATQQPGERKEDQNEVAPIIIFHFSQIYSSLKLLHLASMIIIFKKKKNNKNRIRDVLTKYKTTKTGTTPMLAGLRITLYHDHSHILESPSSYTTPDLTRRTLLGTIREGTGPKVLEETHENEQNEIFK